MEWFKKHPKFLQSESNSLSNNNNYRELFQVRNKLFVSHGYIIVRLNAVHRYPVLIVYTDATPYQLPLIFPLKSILAEEIVINLSQMNLYKLFQAVFPYIEFFYELRHQNPRGDLCILEREDLDSTSKFYGISVILKRVRDWYAGHTTGEFPPESIETDFCGHFKNINKETRILYPELFLNPDLNEGDCYAKLFRHIPKSEFIKSERFIYVGMYIDGVNKSGLIAPSDENIQGVFPDEGITTPLHLIQKADVIERMIDEKTILRAHWFHVDKIPGPFNNFNELIVIIGNGNKENGVIRLSKLYENYFKRLPDSFLIGIRYYNKRKELEFQFLSVYRESTDTPINISSDGKADFKDVLDRYKNVDAIIVEKITKQSYHLRNGNRTDINMLSNAIVNVAGVGAIGSEIADCFGKAGIEYIFLLDCQLLNAHNPVRHLAGLDYVGENKTDSVAEIIRNHNPFIQVMPKNVDLFDSEIYQFFDDKSITVSSVADDNVEGFLNEQLVISNKTAFYIRSLRCGKTARIFRVIPGTDACFNCLSLYRKDKTTFIDIPEDPENPTLKNECNNPIRPASAADLKFIASFASRLIIDQVQNGESDKNHWIWSSELFEELPITEPYQVFSQSIPPHSKCPLCNHDKKIQITITKDSLSFMQDLVSENSSIETGGVLAGEIDDSGNLIITNVSGPGPNAIKTEFKFEKDVKFCQNFLDGIYLESNQKIVYVGEWHSHPNSNNNPSSRDIASLSEIAIQSNYLTERPAMIIFSNSGIPSATVHPAGKRYYHTQLQIVDRVEVPFGEINDIKIE